MIKFYSYIPEATRFWPIQPASIKRWNWYHAMVDHLSLLKKTIDPPTHVARCPGIIDICNQGWLHLSYQAFEIETNGDGVSFRWRSELDQKMLTADSFCLDDYVAHHPPTDLKIFGEFRRTSLSSLVKIQSPWFVEIPQGYCLLTIPIPYPENTVFSAATGILRGVNRLNVQLFWHELNGSHVIPPGTPLCQYMLIPDIEVPCEIIDGNKETWQTVNGPIVENLKSRYPHHYTNLVPNFNNQTPEEPA